MHAQKTADFILFEVCSLKNSDIKIAWTRQLSFDTFHND